MSDASIHPDTGSLKPEIYSTSARATLRESRMARQVESGGGWFSTIGSGLVTFAKILFFPITIAGYILKSGVGAYQDRQEHKALIKELTNIETEKTKQLARQKHFEKMTLTELRSVKMLLPYFKSQPRGVFTQIIDNIRSIQLVAVAKAMSHLEKSYPHLNEAEKEEVAKILVAESDHELASKFDEYLTLVESKLPGLSTTQDGEVRGDLEDVIAQKRSVLGRAGASDEDGVITGIINDVFTRKFLDNTQVIQYALTSMSSVPQEDVVASRLIPKEIRARPSSLGQQFEPTSLADGKVIILVSNRNGETRRVEILIPENVRGENFSRFLSFVNESGVQPDTAETIKYKTAFHAMGEALFLGIQSLEKPQDIPAARSHEDLVIEVVPGTICVRENGDLALTYRPPEGPKAEKMKLATIPDSDAAGGLSRRVTQIVNVLADSEEVQSVPERFYQGVALNPIEVQTVISKKTFGETITQALVITSTIELENEKGPITHTTYFFLKKDEEAEHAKKRFKEEKIAERHHLITQSKVLVESTRTPPRQELKELIASFKDAYLAHIQSIPDLEVLKFSETLKSSDLDKLKLQLDPNSELIGLQGSNFDRKKLQLYTRNSKLVRKMINLVRTQMSSCLQPAYDVYTEFLSDLQLHKFTEALKSNPNKSIHPFFYEKPALVREIVQFAQENNLSDKMTFFLLSNPDNFTSLIKKHTLLEALNTLTQIDDPSLEELQDLSQSEEAIRTHLINKYINLMDSELGSAIPSEVRQEVGAHLNTITIEDLCALTKSTYRYVQNCRELQTLGFHIDTETTTSSSRLKDLESELGVVRQLTLTIFGFDVGKLGRVLSLAYIDRLYNRTKLLDTTIIENGLTQFIPWEVDQAESRTRFEPQSPFSDDSITWGIRYQVVEEPNSDKVTTRIFDVGRSVTVSTMLPDSFRQKDEHRANRFKFLYEYYRAPVKAVSIYFGEQAQADKRLPDDEMVALRPDALQFKIEAQKDFLRGVRSLYEPPPSIESPSTIQGVVDAVAPGTSYQREDGAYSLLPIKIENVEFDSMITVTEATIEATARTIEEAQRQYLKRYAQNSKTPPPSDRLPSGSTLKKQSQQGGIIDSEVLSVTVSKPYGPNFYSMTCDLQLTVGTVEHKTAYVYQNSTIVEGIEGKVTKEVLTQEEADTQIEAHRRECFETFKREQLPRELLMLQAKIYKSGAALE